MSELETMNFKAIAASLRNMNEEMTIVKAEIVELKRTNAQLVQLLHQIQQRQIVGLAAQVGTGPTER